jgi:hypothetical protein
MDPGSNIDAFLNMCRTHRQVNGGELHEDLQRIYDELVSFSDEDKRNYSAEHQINRFNNIYGMDEEHVAGFGSAVSNHESSHNHAGARVDKNAKLLYVYKKRDDRCCLAAVKIKNNRKTSEPFNQTVCRYALRQCKRKPQLHTFGNDRFCGTHQCFHPRYRYLTNNNDNNDGYPVKYNFDVEEGWCGTAEGDDQPKMGDFFKEIDSIIQEQQKVILNGKKELSSFKQRVLHKLEDSIGGMNDELQALHQSVIHDNAGDDDACDHSDDSDDSDDGDGSAGNNSSSSS